MITVPEELAGNQCLREALPLAELGWPIVPLHGIVDGRCTCGKNCGKCAGKHPLTRRGLKDATTDPDTIIGWWTEAPWANVAIRTGPPTDNFVGLWMIGPDGKHGCDVFAKLAYQLGGARAWNSCGRPPKIPRSQTGGGGNHLFFLWPEGGGIPTLANVNGLPIDLRGDGGLVVLPPSLHYLGLRYRWIDHPSTTPLGHGPAWLVEWARSGKGTNRSARKKTFLTVGPDRTPDVRQRAIAYLEACPPAISGSGGHAQTFEVARAVVFGFDLGPEVGFELLRDYYNPKCQPPWSDAELRHKCQDADTKPYDKPRGWLLREGRPQTAGPSGSSWASSNGQAGNGTAQAFAGDEDIETLPMPPPPEWPQLDDAALQGLAGDIVRAVAPHTESDPVAILGQLLAHVGNALGRGPHYLVEGDAHHTNLFVNIVGRSAHGRKGTSRGRVRQLMTLADPDWCERCAGAGGLSTGEGLIARVRDKVVKIVPSKDKSGLGFDEEVLDEGVDDKRLLIEEAEFGQVLKVMQREGNSLSPVLRQAWDSGRLQILTKNSPARATGAHISITGHITRPELLKYLRDTEMFNGFANRFLWLLAERSQLLPDGGAPVDLAPLASRLTSALNAARQIGAMERSDAARQLWCDHYARLTADKPGLYGAVTARAEAQVLRLSMLYALLAGSRVIEVEDLQAALALWQYANTSARIIFGQPPEDPLLAKILDKLRQHPDGLTRSQLHFAFQRNLPAGQLIAALATLRDRGDIFSEQVITAGRPAERWRLRATKERSKGGAPEDCRCEGDTKERSKGADQPSATLLRSFVPPPEKSASPQDPLLRSFVPPSEPGQGDSDREADEGTKERSKGSQATGNGYIAPGAPPDVRKTPFEEE